MTHNDCLDNQWLVRFSINMIHSKMPPAASAWRRDPSWIIVILISVAGTLAYFFAGGAV